MERFILPSCANSIHAARAERAKQSVKLNKQLKMKLQLGNPQTLIFCRFRSCVSGLLMTPFAAASQFQLCLHHPSFDFCVMYHLSCYSPRTNYTIKRNQEKWIKINWWQICQSSSSLSANNARARTNDSARHAAPSSWAWKSIGMCHNNQFIFHFLILWIGGRRTHNEAAARERRGWGRRTNRNHRNVFNLPNFLWCFELNHELYATEKCCRKRRKKHKKNIRRFCPLISATFRFSSFPSNSALSFALHVIFFWVGNRRERRDGLMRTVVVGQDSSLNETREGPSWSIE